MTNRLAPRIAVQVAILIALVLFTHPNVNAQYGYSKPKRPLKEIKEWLTSGKAFDTYPFKWFEYRNTLLSTLEGYDLSSVNVSEDTVYAIAGRDTALFLFYKDSTNTLRFTECEMIFHFEDSLAAQRFTDSVVRKARIIYEKEDEALAAMPKMWDPETGDYRKPRVVIGRVFATKESKYYGWVCRLFEQMFVLNWKSTEKTVRVSRRVIC
jgi:hypothetical protein